MYPFLPDMLTNLTYANYADDGVSSGAANQISDGSRLAPGTDSDWDNSYALIRVANNILEKSADVTGAEAERYRGEARFFRAWANFELVKRFGDVPLILRTFDVFDTLTVAHRTNREKVLDTVYADLDNAIATLPDVSNL
ncbi:MAG: RagB/SusD family nutrient uptake outer membrane protein, partial [Bacteroidales bacterium]|nr:RagB/SusD family nutrient uptake outer membrane protein [Bacteroidales bacterium]